MGENIKTDFDASPDDPIEVIEVERLICDTLTASGAVQADGASMASGTVMVFLQDSAPTGWTKVTDSDLDDAAIVVTDPDIVAWGTGKGNPSGQAGYEHTHAAGSTHTHTYQHNHVMDGDGELTGHRHDYIWVGGGPTAETVVASSGTVAFALTMDVPVDASGTVEIDYDTKKTFQMRNSSGTIITNPPTGSGTATGAAATDTSGNAVKYHSVILATKD
jgi:hypothetical protein